MSTMNVAYAADKVREAKDALIRANDEGVLPDSSHSVDVDIAQRLVDNATVLLEQAKVYQKRLKAWQRLQDRERARWAREASKA